jgi:nicotinamide riboside kinase
MWARIKYGKKIPVVEEALKEDVTSLYLLCRPLIPWEPDPLRDAPLLLDRAWIYNHYLKELSAIQAR